MSGLYRKFAFFRSKITSTSKDEVTKSQVPTEVLSKPKEEEVSKSKLFSKLTLEPFKGVHSVLTTVNEYGVLMVRVRFNKKNPICTLIPVDVVPTNPIHDSAAVLSINFKGNSKDKAKYINIPESLFERELRRGFSETIIVSTDLVDGEFLDSAIYLRLPNKLIFPDPSTLC